MTTLPITTETPRGSPRRAQRIGLVCMLPVVLAVGIVLASIGRQVVPGVVELVLLLAASSVAAVAVVQETRRIAHDRSAHDAILEAAKRDRHLASLGEVSAVLAHEIRNPLAALKGHAQILVEAAEPGTKLHAKAQRVVNEAIRVEKLTDDLLAFARTGKLRTRSVDLRPLVTQAVSVVGPELVTLRLPAAPVMAELDAGRMLQLVDNLLRNATRHGKPPIEVDVIDDRDEVAIQVRDHGKGIPEDRLERIFEPFVSDATRGSGLGLAVVRRVAVLHGGRVSASNHSGGGAVFRVELPKGAPEGMR